MTTRQKNILKKRYKQSISVFYLTSNVVLLVVIY